MFSIRVLMVCLGFSAVLEIFKPCTRGPIRVRNLLRNDPILNTNYSYCSVFNMMSLSENISQRKNVLSSYVFFGSFVSTLFEKKDNLNFVELFTLKIPLSHLSPYIPAMHPFWQLPVTWSHFRPALHLPQLWLHSKPYVWSSHSVINI